MWIKKEDLDRIKKKLDETTVELAVELAKRGAEAEKVKMQLLPARRVRVVSGGQPYIVDGVVAWESPCPAGYFTYMGYYRPAIPKYLRLLGHDGEVVAEFKQFDSVCFVDSPKK